MNDFEREWTFTLGEILNIMQVFAAPRREQAFQMVCMCDEKYGKHALFADLDTLHFYTPSLATLTQFPTLTLVASWEVCLFHIIVFVLFDVSIFPTNGR